MHIRPTCKLTKTSMRLAIADLIAATRRSPTISAHCQHSLPKIAPSQYNATHHPCPVLMPKYKLCLAWYTHHQWYIIFSYFQINAHCMLSLQSRRSYRYLTHLQINKSECVHPCSAHASPLTCCAPSFSLVTEDHKVQWLEEH